MGDVGRLTDAELAEWLRLLDVAAGGPRLAAGRTYCGMEFFDAMQAVADCVQPALDYGHLGRVCRALTELRELREGILVRAVQVGERDAAIPAGDLCPVAGVASLCGLPAGHAGRHIFSRGWRAELARLAAEDAALRAALAAAVKGCG